MEALEGQTCVIVPPATPRTSPTEIHASIAGPPWKVGPDLIQLQDGGDVVVWDLGPLFASVPEIVGIGFEFLAGGIVSSIGGPFGRLDVDLVGRTATGSLPDGVKACYRYNIVVTMKVGGGFQSARAFAVDPQIDNIPPPPHTLDPDGDERDG